VIAYATGRTKERERKREQGGERKRIRPKMPSSITHDKIFYIISRMIYNDKAIFI